MLRRASMVGVIATVLFATQALAISAEEKMKTCEFGAKAQKLVGTKRSDFIKKCMADDDAPAKPRKAAKPPPAQ